VDAGLPRVKIPASGTSKKIDDRPFAFYFAILKPRLRPVGSVGRQGSLRALEESLLLEQPPAIPGLRLGALLGRGSFGRVHLGEWTAGQRVAVKVTCTLACFEHMGLVVLAVRASCPAWAVRNPNDDWLFGGGALL